MAGLIGLQQQQQQQICVFVAPAGREPGTEVHLVPQTSPLLLRFFDQQTGVRVHGNGHTENTQQGGGVVFARHVTGGVARTRGRGLRDIKG